VLHKYTGDRRVLREVLVHQVDQLHALPLADLVRAAVDGEQPNGVPAGVAPDNVEVLSGLVQIKFSQEMPAACWFVREGRVAACDVSCVRRACAVGGGGPRAHCH